MSGDLTQNQEAEAVATLPADQPAPVSFRSVEDISRWSLILRLFAPADNPPWCLLVRDLLSRRWRRVPQVLDLGFAVLVVSAAVLAALIRFCHSPDYVYICAVIFHGILVITALDFARQLSRFRKASQCVGGPMHLLLTPMSSREYTRAFTRFLLMGTFYWLVPAVTYQAIVLWKEVSSDDILGLLLIDTIPWLAVALLAWCRLIGGWAMAILIVPVFMLGIVGEMADRHRLRFDAVGPAIPAILALTILALWFYCRARYIRVLQKSLPQ